MKLYAPYNYDTNEMSQAHGLACTEDEGKTQQEFADDADINTIVRRFGLTGQLPDDYRPPQTGDFTGVVDFHTAMTAVRQAEERFMEMPPQLRAKFNNDPQQLLNFLDDDKNRNEAETLGLLRNTQTQHTNTVQSAPGTPPATNGETK